MTVTQANRSDPGASFSVERYFALINQLRPQLPRVGAGLLRDGVLTKPEIFALGGYLDMLARSFEALSQKYARAQSGDIATLRPRLSIDHQESGLPMASEFQQLATDALQAPNQLAASPSVAELLALIEDLSPAELEMRRGLGHALSQRIYHQILAAGGLYLARNDAEAHWLAQTGGQRRWLLSWAVYDSQSNMPVVYLMELEDAGSVALPRDPCRWPAVQAHIAAQQLNWLKLPTIAQSFAGDFADLRPREVKRLHLGPFHAPGFTHQEGPLSAALTSAIEAQQGWAMVFTLERLVVSTETRERTGWLSSAEQQLFTRDPFLGADVPVEGSATQTTRFVILPEVVSQVLDDERSRGFSGVTRLVIRRSGHHGQGGAHDAMEEW